MVEQANVFGRCCMKTNVLAGNKIGPEGARAISSGLERNSTLTSLHIGGESTLAAMKVSAMISGRVIVRVC